MKDLQPCGTWAAYKRHLKAHETPCEACMRANRRRAAEYYARRGRAAYNASRRPTVDRDKP